MLGGPRAADPELLNLLRRQLGIMLSRLETSGVIAIPRTDSGELLQEQVDTTQVESDAIDLTAIPRLALLIDNGEDAAIDLDFQARRSSGSWVNIRDTYSLAANTQASAVLGRDRYDELKVLATAQSSPSSGQLTISRIQFSI